MLKYFKWFRVLAFCKEVEDSEADFIYIEGTDNFEAICRIEKTSKGQKPQHLMFFDFEGLKYEIVNGKAIPVGFRIFTEYKELQESGHFHRGIDSKIEETQR